MHIAVTLKQLKAINKNSIKHEYNRNLEWAEFERVFKRGMKKRGMWKGASSTYILLESFMKHANNSTQFKGREAHERCAVFTDNICSVLFVDVVAADYERLLKTNKTFSNVA